jgi:hypothetical protein
MVRIQQKNWVFKTAPPAKPIRLTYDTLLLKANILAFNEKFQLNCLLLTLLFTFNFPKFYYTYSRVFLNHLFYNNIFQFWLI